ncbi:MAG: MlaD family protein [Solirubrobacteraceae bacterium]
MKRAMKTHGVSVAYIVGFAVAAALAGSYILVQQRLQLPFQKRYEIAVAFPNTVGLSPGLGQPANVAGVRVGQIDSAALVGGRSLVKLSIDPSKLPRVYANASATLHPNTPLEDMQIDIAPGGPPAAPLGSGAMIPLAQTQVPIQSDSFLGALDADTREYFAALVSAAGAGVNHRGPDLRALLRTIGPTSRQVRELTDALAARRVQLSRLVHNLAALAVSTNGKDREIAQVIVAGNATLRSLAGQTSALSASLDQLPGTLSDARRTLLHATTFANQLGPTARGLEPAARLAPAAIRAGGELVAVGEPFIRSHLRPFTKTATPPLTDLLPATRELNTITPDLASAFNVLNYLTNELVYNAGGRAQSYLFWLAWFVHNGNSFASTQDAHGSILRGFPLVSCSSLIAQPSLTPLVSLLTGVAPSVCGK